MSTQIYGLRINITSDLWNIHKYPLRSVEYLNINSETNGTYINIHSDLWSIHTYSLRPTEYT